MAGIDPNDGWGAGGLRADHPARAYLTLPERREAISRSAFPVQHIYRAEEHRVEHVLEELPRDEEPDESERPVAPDERLIFPGGVIAQKNRHGTAAVERRKRQQVERGEQQIEREERAHHHRQRGPHALGVARGHFAEADAVRCVENVRGDAGTDQRGGEDDEQQVRAGAGERHERAPLGVTHRPLRIERCARVAERPAGHERTRDRQDEHAERLATDVRDGIERNLPAVIRREIAAARRGPRVRRFVERGGEQEDDVVDERALEVGHGIRVSVLLGRPTVSLRRLGAE